MEINFIITMLFHSLRFYSELLIDVLNENGSTELSNIIGNETIFKIKKILTTEFANEMLPAEVEAGAIKFLMNFIKEKKVQENE